MQAQQQEYYDPITGGAIPGGYSPGANGNFVQGPSQISGAYTGNIYAPGKGIQYTVTPEMANAAAPYGLKVGDIVDPTHPAFNALFPPQPQENFWGGVVLPWAMTAAAGAAGGMSGAATEGAAAGSGALNASDTALIDSASAGAGGNAGMTAGIEAAAGAGANGADVINWASQYPGGVNPDGTLNWDAISQGMSTQQGVTPGVDPDVFPYGNGPGIPPAPGVPGSPPGAPPAAPGGPMSPSDIVKLVSAITGIATGIGGATNPRGGATPAAELTDAGRGVLNAGFDPRSAMYNRTLQQIQDQARASSSAHGVAMSPFAAGTENKAVSDFNIDWQNQQLQRMISALGGFTSAAGGSNAAATTANQGLAQSMQAILGGAKDLGPFLDKIWGGGRLPGVSSGPDYGYYGYGG